MKQRIAYAFSRERFNEYINTNFPSGVIPDNYAVISISYVEHKNHKLCDAHNVLNMDFDDIDAETAIMPTYLEWSWELFAQWLTTHYRTGVKSWVDSESIFCMGTDWKIFDWMDALRLADFIYTNKDCNFLIHCEAGMSRSQAVVKLLNDLLGDRYEYERNPNNNNCFPNMWVVNATKRVIRLMIDIGIWKDFDEVKPKFVINPETMNYKCNWCHNEDIIIKAGTSVCTFKCPKCGNVDKF